MKRWILTRFDRWLRRQGCCILPFTEGRFLVATEGRIYNVDLEQPYGHKIQSSHPA